MRGNDRHDTDLLYRLDAHFTGMNPIGAVTDGFRSDNTFEGDITVGRFTGGHVTGIDYFRIRTDGVGVVDAREQLTVDGTRIAIWVRGYVLPPAGLPPVPPEQFESPDFSWPDLPFAIHAVAGFETAAPQFAYLNRMIVSHTGPANMASGELTVEARLLPPYASGGPGQRPHGDLLAASAGR